MVSGIVGGSVADPTRYPYFCGHVTTREVVGESATIRGGTLIAPDVVLTDAGRITPDFDGNAVLSIKVWVNKTSVEKSGYEYERNARFWLPHPDADYDIVDNYIGLIFLDEPVIGVPLVKLNRKTSIPKTGQSFTAIGLGLTNDVPEVFPENLMQVGGVDAVPWDVCTKAMEPGVFVEDLGFCAGGERRGPCWYDGGAPLLDLTDKRSAHPDKDVQVGIYVSGSLPTDTLGSDNEQCMLRGYPAYFARVSHYAKWIDSSVRMHSQYSTKGSKKGSKKSHKDIFDDRDKDNLKGGKKGGIRNRHI